MGKRIDKDMRIVDLVNYFRNGGKFNEFCLKQSINVESEAIEVYMQKPFSLDSQLAFFEIEKTEGAVEYCMNNTKYYNLFDFYYFMDVIEESKNSQNNKLTDIEIAKVLLSYAISDA